MAFPLKLMMPPLEYNIQIKYKTYAQKTTTIFEISRTKKKLNRTDMNKSVTSQNSFTDRNFFNL